MPELPEVETLRLGMQKYLVGHTIESVEIRLKKIVTGDTKHVIGAKVIGVRRFGKGLVIDLDNGYSMAAHVKLTGQFIYRSKVKKVEDVAKVAKQKIGGELPNKFTHVIFRLNKGAVLYYNDVRQFGWIRIIQSGPPAGGLKDQSFFRDLGPEPLKDLTFSKFAKIVSSASAPIKTLLMDQKKISGIGNIYANDSLFDARIDPKRKAKSLTQKEIERLYQSINKVLKNALSYNGASDVNFVNILGEEGEYQNHFLVYGRKGQKCHRCGTTIKKIKLAGRGTYFCEMCQT